MSQADPVSTSPGGRLIVNADDWGRNTLTTDRIAKCVGRGAVSSVSAMVFMEDSERAAALAREEHLDVGLHLNFTTPFSAARCPARLVERQADLVRYLRSRRLAQVVFHPGLAGPFAYVAAAQIDEFRRLYGVGPDRVDGHHHMHLCANVLYARLLPAGTMVRRNFSFQPGEKSAWNRMYRRWVDGLLDRRHRIVDYLFSLRPLDEPGRLERILALARQHVVELETHPADSGEYRFLTSGEISRRDAEVRISSASAVRSLHCTH
jgi:hypothetical protein